MKIEEFVDRLKYEVESDDGYMGVSADVIRQALTIIEAQRAALEYLIDAQNGPPLLDKKNLTFWTEAMTKARAALEMEVL